MTPPRGRHIAGRQPALEWGAIVLGALTFVWGFLDWWGTGSGGLNGYRLLSGDLPIGLALVASLLAVVNLRPDRTERTAWLAIGTSALAVLFTIVAMAVKPTFVQLIEQLAQLGGRRVSVSIQVGLILTLVSTVLQLACLVAAWLFASGRLAIGGTHESPPTMPIPTQAPPPVAGAHGSAPPPPTAGPTPGSAPPADEPFDR